MSAPDLAIHPEVAQALAERRAVVALESTIIAHGMPHPQNLQTAQAVEGMVRRHGAVPATIALLDGRIRVGLNADELTRIAIEKDVRKASRRDLAYCLSQRLTAATTVSATMVAAHLAGIEVFVTGGIGGVHRGASSNFDISADLQELARTPVVVVCAGAKSILDIPLTLEYLETHGVPVLSSGQCAFAAFYCQDSGHPADFRLDAPADQARFVRTHWRLGLRSGIVLSTPVPAQHALPKEAVDTWISQALEEAASRGVSGKATTPFLLDRIKVLSGGRSLQTNIGLVLHNAEVGAQLALALMRE
jgi:pseudouridine-5'-phosphate glycosidase